MFCAIASSKPKMRVCQKIQSLFWMNQTATALWSLVMCFLRDSLVALTLEHTEQINPPVFRCFDSTWVLTWDTFLEVNEHWRQYHSPFSSLCMLLPIKSSNSRKSIKWRMAYGSVNCVFSLPLLWDKHRHILSIGILLSWHAWTLHVFWHWNFSWN